MRTTRRSRKKLLWIPVTLGMFLGFLFGARSVFAHYFVYTNNHSSRPPRQCHVSPEQTVVKWKSGTTQDHCRSSVAGVCIWPISHRHVTYKVTVNDGVPLRNGRGRVISAINGDQMRSWTTYDAASWNTLENKPFYKYNFSDFEPIAANEYVVMVETRYRLFTDINSTLGICVQ
jgi:hypothetical protein